MTVRLPLRPTRRLAVGTAGVLASLGLLSACGTGSVAASDLESRIDEQVTTETGTAPSDVTCPDDLEGEEGATTTCVLTAEDGTEYDAAVEVTSVDGSEVNFSFEVATEPNS